MKNIIFLILSLVLISCSTKTHIERLISLKTELDSIKSCRYELSYYMERLHGERIDSYNQQEIIHCEIQDTIFGYKWSKLGKYGPMHYDGVNIVQIFPEQKEAWCDTIKYVACPMPASPVIIQVKSLINYSIANINDTHLEIISGGDTSLLKFRFDNLSINFSSLRPFHYESNDTTICKLYLNKNLNLLKFEYKQKNKIVSNTFNNFENFDNENKAFNALKTIPLNYKRKPIYN